MILVPALVFAADDQGYLLENGSEALGKTVRMIQEAQEELLILKTAGFELEKFKTGLQKDRVQDLGAVEFIGDEMSTPTQHRNRIHSLIESAKHTVRIETPWIVPTNLFSLTIEKLRAKLADFKILTNSPRSAENPFRAWISRMHSSALNHKWPARLMELGSGRSLHSKYMLVDDNTGYIGSYNVGPRSEGPNLEVGVIIVSPELIQEATVLFEKRARDAVPMPRHRWLGTPCTALFSFLAKGFF